jgi:hypothetical protein
MSGKSTIAASLAPLLGTDTVVIEDDQEYNESEHKDKNCIIIRQTTRKFVLNTLSRRGCRQIHAKLAHRLQCSSFGCDGLGTKKCSQCMVARYCGPECQRLNWKVHKQVCHKEEKT